MTPQALKASILQLAIQGKLVPQHPEEGTAEDLYQQIQAEKQRLIAEGKIKKEKPLPPIEEEELPFDIPETWKWVRLGELAWYLDAGKSPKCEKKPVVGNEWGVITTTAIQENYFDQTQNKVLPPKFTYSPFMQVRANDILITRAGPTNRTGVACLAREVTSNLILSDKTVRINMSYDYAHRAFIVFALNSPPIRQQIIGKMSGMDKQQVNVSQDKMREIFIPLPPLEEQKRIVDKIEEMLPLVERYGEAYEQLQDFNKRFPDDLRKSILQEAIQGKLVPQRPEEGTAEDLYQQIQAEKKRLIASGTIKKEKPLPPIEEDKLPFDIPETWKWVRLGACGTFTRGSGIKKTEVVDEGLPCVRYGQLYTTYKTRFSEAVSYIPAELFAKCKQANQGDILMALTGENKVDIAMAVLYEGTPTLAISGDMTKFTPLLIDPLYLVYTLNSPYGINCKTERSTGDIIVHTSNDKLSTIPIPLPPYAEQKRIVAKIEQLLQLSYKA